MVKKFCFTLVLTGSFFLTNAVKANGLSVCAGSFSQPPLSEGEKVVQILRLGNFEKDWFNDANPLRPFFNQLVGGKFRGAFDDNLQTIALTIDYAHLMLDESLNLTRLGPPLSLRLALYAKKVNSKHPLLGSVAKKEFRTLFATWSWETLDFTEPLALPERAESVRPVEPATLLELAIFHQDLENLFEANEIISLFAVDERLGQFEKLVHSLHEEIVLFRQAIPKFSNDQWTYLVHKISKLMESSVALLKVMKNSRVPILNTTPSTRFTVQFFKILEMLTVHTTDDLPNGWTDGDLVSAQTYENLKTAAAILKLEAEVPSFGVGLTNFPNE